MPDGIESALRERYQARSAFFWRKVRDARFKEWQLRARDASWENLIWDWGHLGITPVARETAKRLKFVPSEIFAHPDVLAASPELLNYYRLLACLPNKGLGQIRFGAKRGDRTGISLTMKKSERNS